VLSRFHELFKLPFTGLGTYLKKLKEKPDEVKRMTKALLRANRNVRVNREETVQTMMEWINVDREKMRTLWRRSLDGAFRAVFYL
jgi:ABC-type nitrate/sulfonate/bicarbonate transport system substrate-binding protein